jgi:hypothetical protein
LNAAFPVPRVGPFGIRLGCVLLPASGGVGYSEFLVSAAYGRRFLKFLDAGTSAGFFSVSLNDRSASAFVMDLGCRASFVIPLLLAEHRLSGGISLRNIGTGLKFVFDTVSLNHWLVVGGSYSVNRLLLTVDARFLLNYEQTAVYAAGVEYSFGGQLCLRGGVETTRSQTRFYFGLSFGAAFASVRPTLDYAFNPISATGGAGHNAGLNMVF